MQSSGHGNTREFDVVVIGAGPAGEVAAGKLGQAGLSIAIVEGHLVGGECPYYGCMPSKALLRPDEALAEARRVPGASEAVLGHVDVEAVLRRPDEVIHSLDDSGQLPWLEERNVTLVRGHGRLDERRVRVGDDVLVARRAVVVAVGTGAVLPCTATRPRSGRPSSQRRRDDGPAPAPPGRLRARPSRRQVAAAARAADLAHRCAPARSSSV